MPKRETIEPNKGDKRYVRRDDQGQFKEQVDVGKSSATDQRRQCGEEGIVVLSGRRHTRLSQHLASRAEADAFNFRSADVDADSHAALLGTSFSASRQRRASAPALVVPDSSVALRDGWPNGFGADIYSGR